MVMELTPERAADFQTACAYERVFGSEILALLRVYGLDDGRVCFYLEEQEITWDELLEDIIKKCGSGIVLNSGT